jgi:hypothetical protein
VDITEPKSSREPGILYDADYQEAGEGKKIELPGNT